MAARSDALFINRITLRGPEMEILHKHLLMVEGASRADLVDRFVPAGEEQRAGSADTLNSAMAALCTLGLATEVSGGEEPCYVAVPSPNGQPFAVGLLGALRQLSGRQAVFMDLYEWCIRSGTTRVLEADLLNAARQYVPSEAGWTLEKIRFWRTMAVFVGIALDLRGGLIIAPRACQLGAWLAGLLPRREGWAEQVFRSIDERFAPCFDRNGHLHAGWAQALEVLQAAGQVELRIGSDAPALLHARLSAGDRWSRIFLPVQQESPEAQLP